MLELISIHIPKTAGRSFKQILLQAYGEPGVCKINQNELSRTDQEVGLELVGSARVLHGHLHYAQVAGLHAATGARVVTWLRDPVERVFSNYCYRLRKAYEDDNAPVKTDTSLLEFASKPLQRNQMCRFLEGISLQDLFFFGMTEFFEEDLQEMATRLGWGDVEPVTINSNQNFKRKVPALTKEQHTALLELNRQDVALYESALAMRKLPAGRSREAEAIEVEP